MVIFLMVPKWRLKLAKNALKCVRQASTVQKTKIEDAGRSAIFACATHFNAFLANFRRHFETLRKMATPQVIYKCDRLNEGNPHSNFLVFHVSNNFHIKHSFYIFIQPFLLGTPKILILVLHGEVLKNIVLEFFNNRSKLKHAFFATSTLWKI